MLTGLELYYLERAGYFVRRGALTGALREAGREAAERIAQKGRFGVDAQPIYSLLHPDWTEPVLLEALAHPQIIGVPEDLYREYAVCLQADLLVHMPGEGFRSAWHRDHGPDLDAPLGEQMAHLERSVHNVRVNAALLADEALLVMPGTHTSPLTSEQRDLLKADPCAELVGQVRIRLEPGDLVFYNGNLLHREEIVGGETRLTLHAAFVSRLQPPAQRETPAWLLEPATLESLPPRLRPMMVRSVR
jgi:hypothetical protein